MGMRRGYILEEDTPVRREAAYIRRFLLSTGEHVYLPLDVTAFVMEHSPAEEFVFIEKGLLGRTAWAGSTHDVRLALVRGDISPKDLAGLSLRHLETPPGWDPLLYDDDHEFVGSKLEALATDMRQHGRADIAGTIIVDGWVKTMSVDGCCVAHRTDSTHGAVWCWAKRGHDRGHAPACPRCEMVKDLMRTVAVHVGTWGT